MGGLAMLFAGLAFVVSREGVTFRDPNTRSCRVYGLYDGMIYASTYGSDTRHGMTFGAGYVRYSRLEWLWPSGGVFDYHSLNDPHAVYGSDWRVELPLWILFAVGASVVTPYFAARMPRYQRLWKRRRAALNRERIQSLLARGICASCGYSIAALPELDGRRLCPECGACSAQRRRPGVA